MLAKTFLVIFLSWDVSLIVPVYGLNEETEPNSLSYGLKVPLSQLKCGRSLNF